MCDSVGAIILSSEFDDKMVASPAVTPFDYFRLLYYYVNSHIA